MADRIFSVASWTLEAVASAASYTDNKYLGLMGGSSTQMLKVKEVRVAGMESSTSSPVILLLARDSTVQVTPTALTTGQSDAPRHPSTAALAAPPVAFTASTTKPQRSATLVMATLGFNALGGLTKERFAEGYEPTILGNTASLGEMSLSGFTGSSLALVTGHIVYEPL